MRETIYVCGACGKTNEEQWKLQNGWDESCAMNAVLCFVDTLKYATNEQTGFRRVVYGDAAK